MLAGQAVLNGQGYRVLRVTTPDVLGHLDLVVDLILSATPPTACGGPPSP